MTKLLFTIGVLLAFVMDAGAASGGETFRARLTGDNEVPPVVTDTSGRSEIRFNKEKDEAEYTLRVNDGVRVTQAHIHCAPPGVNGPIIVFLAGFHNLGWDVDGRWISNATFTDQNVIPPPAGSTCPHVINNLRDLFEAMREGDTYVNVHTVAHAGGEIRGQLESDKD